jgi:hypothetical protein
VAERGAQGQWAEIRAVLLNAGERAPSVPRDTARVPLEMRCKGFLSASAEIGARAEILTVTGRRVVGELIAVNPGYEHGFGPPLAALLTIGAELRALLDEGA